MIEDDAILLALWDHVDRKHSVLCKDRTIGTVDVARKVHGLGLEVKQRRSPAIHNRLTFCLDQRRHCHVHDLAVDDLSRFWHGALLVKETVGDYDVASDSDLLFEGRVCHHHRSILARQLIVMTLWNDKQRSFLSPFGLIPISVLAERKKIEEERGREEETRMGRERGQRSSERSVFVDLIERRCADRDCRARSIDQCRSIERRFRD